MSSTLARRARRLARLVPVLAVAACLNTDPTPRPLPTFTRMVLNFTPAYPGTPPYTVEITRATSSASRNIAVPDSGGTITVKYFNADGSEDQVIPEFPGEWESRITLLGGTNATIERSETHKFVVKRLAPGSTSALVQLWDNGTRKAALEVTVPVSVQ